MAMEEVFESPLVDIPPPETDLYSFVAEGFQKNPHKRALVDVDLGVSLIFNDLANSIHSAARLLLKHGFTKGSVTACFSDNSLEYVCILLATLRLGGVVAGINKLSNKESLRRMCELCEANYIFADPTRAPMARGIKEELKLKEVFTTDDVLGCITLRCVLHGVGSSLPPPDSLTCGSDSVPLPSFKSLKVDSRKHPAFILFSSGTTGMPKAVMLSHFNIIRLVHNNRYPGMLRICDPNLLSVSLAHIPAVDLLCNALGLGVTSLIMRRFNLEKYIRTIAEHKVPILTLVPTIAATLAESQLLDQVDVGCVKTLLCGAAALPPTVSKKLRERIGDHLNITLAYGLTEFAGTATCGFVDVQQRPPHISEPPDGCSGVLIPGQEAMVLDIETGQPLAAGQNGEILLRGDKVMLGYKGNAQVTEETIDSDGWLHTGDIGHFDENGYLFIVDRRKDIIKYKGHQVSPSELEAVLTSHPAIESAAVVGLQDNITGEVPHAWVVLRQWMTLTELEVTTYMESRVEPFKRLRGGVRFVNSIPMSASGKILRKDILAEIKAQGDISNQGKKHSTKK